MRATAPETTAQARWRLACAALAAAVFALVIWLSLRAYAGTLPNWLPPTAGADKVGHFFLFGGLAFFLDGAARYRALTRRIAWLHLAPTLLWIAVATEEWAQRFSKHRTPEWADLAADTLGIALAAWLSFAIDRRLGRDARARSEADRRE